MRLCAFALEPESSISGFPGDGIIEDGISITDESNIRLPHVGLVHYVKSVDLGEKNLCCVSSTSFREDFSPLLRSARIRSIDS